MRYWGKTFNDGGWRHLCRHSIDVAATLAVLLEKDQILAKRIEEASPVPYAGTRDLLLFLAAVHDLGKFSLTFQNARPELAEEFGLKSYSDGVHHTRMGLEFWEVQRVSSELGFAQEEALRPLVNAALGHHGVPVETEPATRRTRLRFDGTAEDAMAFVREAADMFLHSPLTVDLRDESFRRLSWLAAGLFILADWIGSNDRWFGPDPSWTSIAGCWEETREAASLAVAGCRVASVPPSVEMGFSDLFSDLLKDAVPSPLQRAVVALEPQLGPELLVFEDLTGGGKTEAALLAAYRAMRSGNASGVFMGLPTMATANAMYGRLAKSYRALFAESDASLILAHGSRSLHQEYLDSIESLERPSGTTIRDDGGAVCADWFADNRKKALLAPCGAGTIDQALLAVLSTRHQSLRLLGLSRSVLVVDEVHAYDEYTGKLLQSLLTFQAALGGSAVLLSATLPMALRRSLTEAWRLGRSLAGADVEDSALQNSTFPLMTRVMDARTIECPVDASRSLNVSVQLVHDEAVMFDALVEAARAGACACWVRNTVADAVTARRRLVDELGLSAEDVLLFHARYAGCDRLETEQKVLNLFDKDSGPGERTGKILIATQVVEQSLDLDFDLMLSDLAPMELMIQRAGRCHRHASRGARPSRYAAPRLLVLSPAPDEDVAASWYADLFPVGQWVYPRPALLWRTARLLADRGGLCLPEEARALVEGAYGNGGPVAPAVFDEAESKALGEGGAERALGEYASLRFKAGYDLDGGLWNQDVDALTRLGEPTHQVRLIRSEGGRLQLWGATKDVGVNRLTCQLSEVRVPLSKLKEPLVPDGLADRLEAFREAMPDKGRWCHCLVLNEREPDLWVGNGLDVKGREVEIRYGKEGLEVVLLEGS